MSQDLDKTRHSAYRLTYHLVLVIKYRRKVINENVYDRLMEIFINIGLKYDIEVYIHILFKATPNINLQKFVNAYKSASSRLIKNEYCEIKNSLRKSAFWKKGYFITTTSGANTETIKKYIEKQK